MATPVLHDDSRFVQHEARLNLTRRATSIFLTQEISIFDCNIDSTIKSILFLQHPRRYHISMKFSSHLSPDNLALSLSLFSDSRAQYAQLLPLKRSLSPHPLTLQTVKLPPVGPFTHRLFRIASPLLLPAKAPMPVRASPWCRRCVRNIVWGGGC